MIAPALVAEVQRLLGEGKLSQRSIARLTGVSRGTVGSIAAGRRPDYEALRAANDEEEPLGPPQRCPDCGGMVYMPCLLCRARQTRATKSQPRRRMRSVEIAERLRLALRPEHHARYDQVRAWRRQAGAQTAATLCRVQS